MRTRRAMGGRGGVAGSIEWKGGAVAGRGLGAERGSGADGWAVRGSDGGRWVPASRARVLERHRDLRALAARWNRRVEGPASDEVRLRLVRPDEGP